jgi:hypothetical protein
LLDSLTAALPLIGLMGWYGCLAAGCGYGREVDTLANYSPLVASELVDVYGIVAPRFNTPYFGMGWCLVILLMVITTGLWKGSANIPRFWYTLGLLSLGMFVIGFFRADHTLLVFGWRGDQVLDMICLVVSVQQSAISLLHGKRGPS